ncbi:MAG: 50S ribosomal protein L35 [Planctomycetes bacterium]|nr:50S ribosomal protein L35 [Planctomycetota bacterium]
MQKRVKVTGTGKIKRHRAGKSHRMYSWSAKRIRRGRSAEICASCDAKVIKFLLGIG